MLSLMSALSSARQPLSTRVQMGVRLYVTPATLVYCVKRSVYLIPDVVSCVYNVSSMIRSRCLHVHEHSAEIHHIRMIRGRLIDSEGRRQLRPLDVLAVEVTSSDVTEMARNVTRRWGQCRSFLTKHESVKHAV
jgi:hypothetical protein